MLELQEKNKDVEDIMEGALDLIIEKDLSIKEKFEEQSELIMELRGLKNPPIITMLPDILLKSILEIREDQQDGENLLHSLIKELTINKEQYIEFLEDRLNTFCSKEDICNCCGTDLLHNYHEEYVGEFQGFPAYQEFLDEGYCPYGCMTNI
ncbi:hypothetical protein [Clostridium perfringens]|uniref:hypothetical protein n=1 Tax=Clostridium perfringens TaxID=1502 RepID=UPI002340A9B5|nr:hypothetical protein [Clostridium perfringens]MDC4245702.1 hypothetical protein [Clostridium perfringens]